MNYGFNRHAASDGEVTINGEIWVRVPADKVSEGVDVRHEVSVKDANGLHAGYGPSRKIVQKAAGAKTTSSWAFGVLWVRAEPDEIDNENGLAREARAIAEERYAEELERGFGR